MCRCQKEQSATIKHVHSKVSTSKHWARRHDTNGWCRAIIFHAGLVLGFQIFARAAVDHDVEVAFQGARELLKAIGVASPQAAIYFDILTSLNNAIRVRRGRVSSRGRSSYVCKIFTFDKPEEEIHEFNGAHCTPSDPSLSNQMLQMEDIMTGYSIGQTVNIGSGEVLLDWDSLDISQWDNFPYIT